MRSKYLPEFVYGSTDGVITTFAITAGAVGAGLNPGIILVLGAASLFADGFSMASSNFLSLKGTTESKKPYTASAVTFVSFVALGALPLIPFVALLFFPLVYPFYWAMLGAGIAFVIIGFSKATLLGNSRLRGALETLVIGALAAIIAYTVGVYLHALV